MLVGSAFGKVTLDTSGMAAGVQSAQKSMESLQKAGQVLGQTMQQIGQTLTIGLTLPIMAMGGAAIKMASSLEETRNKTKVIFGDMSDDMLDWAKTANESLAMTQQEALDAASTFALFGKAAGKSGEELNKFAKQNVALATDFASFFDSSPEEAITAIGAAYRGETEPIRKYGVLLNDAVIKQKAMQMGLMEANGELTMQNRILAVNKLILEQTTSAQGDFVRTSESMANQTRQLQARFKDTLAELGENLLPMALKAVTALNEMLKQFQALPEDVQNSILALAGFLAVLGPILSVIGSLATTISSVSAAWPTITAGIAAIGPALTTVSTVISGTVIPALAGIVPVILTVLPALALLYWAFSTNFMGIRTTAEQLSVVLPYLVKKGVDGLKTTLEQLIFIMPYVMKTGFDQAVLVIQAKAAEWVLIGQNIVNGIIKGIENGWAWLINTVMNLALSAYNAAKSALGIASPSTLFMELGSYSAQGYGVGFTNGMKESNAQIKSQLKDLLGQISQKANVRSDGVITWHGFLDKETLQKIQEAQRLMGKLTQQGGSLGQQTQQLGMDMQGAAAAIDGFKNSTMQTFQETDWSVLGKHITDGLVLGLQNGQNAVVEAARAVAQAAYAASKAQLGISSPSKKFGYLGEMSGLGYAMAFAQAADPEQIARIITQPVNNSTRVQSYQQVNNVSNFASGLTIKQTSRMIEQANNRHEKNNLKLMG